MSALRTLSVALLLTGCDLAAGASEIEPGGVDPVAVPAPDQEATSSEDDAAELPRRTLTESPSATPRTGVWRWDLAGEFVDGCGQYERPIDYALTLVVAGEAYMQLSTHGGQRRECSVANGDFGCDDAERALLPAPAVALEAVDGQFTSDTEGSLAYRLTGECDGPECDAIAADHGIALPCESTALAKGRFMPSVELVDDGCEAETDLVRPASSAQAALTLYNDGYDEMQIHRLDADGHRVLEGTVGPGGHPRLLWTSVGERWVVTDGEGECVSVHRATEDSGTVTLY